MASVARAAKTVGLGARLGLPTSAAELQASLSPTDYVYGQPSAAQLKRLLKQQMGAPQPVSGAAVAPAARGAGFGAANALQAPAAQPLAGAPKPHADDLFGSNLELDDDCLRILLGEDADESAPCASAGSGKGAAGAGSGASEKSSATADAGETEAASHEDDDVAMLFGEIRHAGAPALEPLDLHLLGTAPLPAADDSDTASQAGGDGAAGGAKRSRSACGGSPTSRAPGLVLSMDYEKAAHSINLELLGAGRKSPPGCGAGDGGLPLLSPMMRFAALDAPDSPTSLASGSRDVAPDAAIARHDSAGKRKRAMCV